MQVDSHRLLAAALLGACALAGGCVTASVEQLRSKPASRVADGDAVVVLGRRESAEHATEVDFTDCVSDKLADRRGLTVLPEQSFKDRLFPWFEPRTAPLNADEMAKRLGNPALERSLRKTQVRYIVWLDGNTRDGDKGGGMSCAAGPGGGGCLGFMWWEKKAAYRASVWDLDDLQSLGKISVDASGTSFMPAVILPVPLIARTQAAACGSMAAQLREFLQPAD